MERRTDFELSIEQLEGTCWEDPGPNATTLVEECHALRKKALCTLTDDELRLAVGQEMGFPYLLDLAFERLAEDPLLDTGCFPGDLLANLIRMTDDAWTVRPELRRKLSHYFDHAMSQPVELTESFREILKLPVSGRSAH